MLEAENGQEQLSQVLQSTIEESAGALVIELKRTARSALADARTDRRGFEQRLRRRWKKALDLFEMILIATPEAGAMVDEQYGERASTDNDLTFHALKLLHGRACVTASEVRALLATGHPTGAHARWRTLHELAVVANIIKEHGDDVAERYLLHEHVEARKDLDIYQKHCAALKTEPFSPEECQDIEETYQSLIAQYGKPYGTDWGWAAELPIANHSRPQFPDLEELVGLAHLRPYYRMSNKGVHPTSRSVALNIVDDGPSQVMLAGPTSRGLADAGQGALISLNQVTSSLFLHVFNKLSDPMLLITCHALHHMAREANEAFASIELDLQRENEQLGASEGLSEDLPR